MHFPTLPRRWRLTTSNGGHTNPASMRKPPRAKVSVGFMTATPKKPPSSSSVSLSRSASFSSDPVFKVPAAPPAKRVPSISRLSSFRSQNNSDRCPTCCQSKDKNVNGVGSRKIGFQRTDWRSRSLMDLGPPDIKNSHSNPSSQWTRNRSFSLVGRQNASGVAGGVIRNGGGYMRASQDDLDEGRHHNTSATASIFSNNLRSNSWRNLSTIGRADSSSSKAPYSYTVPLIKLHT